MKNEFEYKYKCSCNDKTNSLSFGIQENGQLLGSEKLKNICCPDCLSVIVIRAIYRILADVPVFELIEATKL